MDSNLLIFVVAIGVQVAGVISIAVARVSERTAGSARYQGYFFVCLVLVGLFTGLMIGLAAESRLICAITLPLMAVGATLDLRKEDARRPVV